MRSLDEQEQAIADGLLRSAVEAMPDITFARIYMRQRMNWLTFAPLRRCRAFHPNYYPWADYGKWIQHHNRHDRRRSKL